MSPTVLLVTRGLLHDLANVATIVDGVRAALRESPTAVAPRQLEDIAAASDRIFQLHADLRSLLPDREGVTALDPRALAADATRMLRHHVERPLTLVLEDGPAAPVLGEAWRVRRQLLEACDGAAGAAETLRFSFRVTGETVEAVSDAGAVFWSSPTLAAARRLEREGR